MGGPRIVWGMEEVYNEGFWCVWHIVSLPSVLVLVLVLVLVKGFSLKRIEHEEHSASRWVERRVEITCPIKSVSVWWVCWSSRAHRHGLWGTSGEAGEGSLPPSLKDANLLHYPDDSMISCSLNQSLPSLRAGPRLHLKAVDIKKESVLSKNETHG